MAKKKSQSPYSKKKKGKAVQAAAEEEDLGRFAGSSDEEDEEHQSHNEKDVETKEPRVIVEHDADDEESDLGEEYESKGDKNNRDVDNDNNDEEPFVTNADAQVEEEPEPGEKMAGAMARILGTAANNKTTSVVLAKTTTPLQRLQHKEKEKMKALKLKRKANRERNLTALHIPLSVATSNIVGEGRLSITKELEQERFHRRVATRGVVALFNAIAQHQNTDEDDGVKSKKADASKMTKHGFLDKIKNTAATMDSSKTSVEDKLKAGIDKKASSAGKWDALKDDFMMKPKKNWDEESSDEDGGEESEGAVDIDEPTPEPEPTRNKRRKVGARE